MFSRRKIVFEFIFLSFNLGNIILNNFDALVEENHLIMIFYFYLFILKI